MDCPKQRVHDFWHETACGEALYLRGRDREAYARQAEGRYRLEPYIFDFAEFDRYQGQKVLEIGVGLGADHEKFTEPVAVLTGIDLTERAMARARALTRRCGFSGVLLRPRLSGVDRLLCPSTLAASTLLERLKQEGVRRKPAFT